MFRDRMIHWARLFESFTCTMSTAMALAKSRMNALLFYNLPSRPVSIHQARIDPTIDVAIAYAQISRLNR